MTLQILQKLLFWNIFGIHVLPKCRKHPNLSSWPNMIFCYKELFLIHFLVNYASKHAYKCMYNFKTPSHRGVWMNEVWNLSSYFWCKSRQYSMNLIIFILHILSYICQYKLPWNPSFSKLIELLYSAMVATTPYI